MIRENEEKIRNRKNQKDDDHIDLDEIDLSLNETEIHNDNNTKHNEHENHIKLNYVKDAEKDKKQESNKLDNDLKIEDIKKDDEKNKKDVVQNENKLVVVQEEENNKDTNINRRDVIKEKIAKIKEDKKKNKKTKNPYFVKTCKFIFYLICLISFYITVKKLLEKFGFIINSDEISNCLKNSNSNSNTDEIPLKQLEISEIKQQQNKAD